MTDEDAIAERYLSLVSEIASADRRLSPLGAGILAALRLGFASDSLSFSRALGVSHALVIREVTALEMDHRLVKVVRRQPRTGRIYYAASNG